MLNKFKPENLGIVGLLLAVTTTMAISVVIAKTTAWIITTWIPPLQGYASGIGLISGLLIFHIHPIHQYVDESLDRSWKSIVRMFDRFRKPSV